MQIDIFSEFSEKLKSLWVYFDNKSNSLPFHSFEWQKYWNERVGQPKYRISICVVVCTIDNQIRAIFPFGIRTVFCARILEFLGAEEADYSAPLLACNMNSNEFTDIWTEVLKSVPPHDIIHFRNLSKLILQSENFLLKRISAKEIGKSYSATLPATFEAYTQSLSRGMIKDNRRMERRLREKGNLKFVILKNENEFNEVLKTMIFQKEARYAISGARNIFFNQSVKNFYSEIHILFNRGFKVHLSALILDDEVLATHLGIHYKDQLYYLMPTFNHDVKWKKFSLGRIHLEKLLQWSIENGVKKFDFTIGGESYKKIWCDDEMSIFRYFKLKSIRGILYYINFHLIELIKSKSSLRKLCLKILSLIYSSSRYKN